MQVRELALAAGEAELQELYLAVPGLLGEYNADAAAACALLQVRRRPSWHMIADPGFDPDPVLISSLIHPVCKYLMDENPVSSMLHSYSGCEKLVISFEAWGMVLQVLLLTIESAQSRAALKVLSQQSQGAASALIDHVLSCDHQSHEGVVLTLSPPLASLHMIETTHVMPKMAKYFV